MARSWDRTQIPKPFSRVALVVGPPIDVPPDADEQILETKRSELEQALHGLVEATNQLLEVS
jgi:lysophospholipid acyltransferase (LPLAT)-like uncharacterized protein